MFISDLDVAAKGLKYSSDKDIIDDNANYSDEDFGPLLPTFNPINSTD